MIPRRAFSKVCAATLATASLAGCSSAPGAPTPASRSANGSGSTSFPSLKQIRAGVLDVGYAEAGPADRPAVLLFHGWPYDIYSYVDVAPVLASAGYRVIVPYLRGYGSTNFLSSGTFRNGQQSAVASDIIALMDALKINQAILGGFDWGSRTANIIAALWPERCKALVAVSGYLITNPKAQMQPLPPEGEYGWWYQYYFSTERGALGYTKYRHDFNKLIWKNLSPRWNFDDATFARTAASFNNPNHVSIVIDDRTQVTSRAKAGAASPGLLTQSLPVRYSGAAFIGVVRLSVPWPGSRPARPGWPARRPRPRSTPRAERT